MTWRNTRGTGIIIKNAHTRFRSLTIRDEEKHLHQMYGMTVIPIFGTLRYEKVGYGSNDLVKVVDVEIENFDGIIKKSIPVSCIHSHCDVTKAYFASSPDAENTEWPEEIFPPHELFQQLSAP